MQSTSDWQMPDRAAIHVSRPESQVFPQQIITLHACLLPEYLLFVWSCVDEVGLRIKVIPFPTLSDALPMEHGFAPPVVRLRCLGYLGAYPLLTDRVAALEVRFVAQSSATLMIGLQKSLRFN